MSFDSFVSEMDATLVGEFGVTAIYNGSTACSAVVDRNVDRVLGDGELLASHTELSVERSITGKVSKGDTFLIESELFSVKRIISDDNSIVVVHVV